MDQRYFELNLPDFIRENGVTDLIFINNVFAANTSVQIQWIQGLMYQYFTPVTEEASSEDEEAPGEDTPEESGGEDEESSSRDEDEPEDDEREDEDDE